MIKVTNRIGLLKQRVIQPARARAAGLGRTGSSFLLVVVLALAGGVIVASPSGAAVGKVPKLTSSPSSLKIAFFTFGSSNTYLVKVNNAVTASAKKVGAHVVTFNANWTVQTQVDQMQSALARGGYNAFIIAPVEGTAVCSLTKQAIKAGILVVTAINTVCGRDSQNGINQWQPGELTMVGGQTPSWWDAYFSWINKDNPSGGQTIILTGPAVSSLTTNTLAAAKKELRSNFDVVATEATDYTITQGYQDATALLTANPGAKILITNYSDITTGAVQAAKALGRLSTLKIYDLGGSNGGQALVKAGEVRMSYLLMPAAEMTLSVNALVEHVEGKKVAHYMTPYVSSDPLLKATHGSLFITKGNVAEFKSLGY